MIITLAIWPFSFYVFPPKWDSIDCFLPFKYFWSNHILEGHWPFWNTYQNLGYPAYSDLQSGLWNPISWLMVLLFGKYTAISLSTEISIYFLIAGLGMYKYSEIITHNKWVRFFCGISLALCGFMVGTTQIMVFIMGIAWLPWILHFVRRIYQTSQLKYMLLLGLFVALETTSASPAYTIILIYTLVAFVGYYLLKTGGSKLKLLGYYLGAGAIAIVLVLPLIVSFKEFQPYFGRAGKLPYIPWIYNGSFDFAEYVSFLFPISTLSKSDFWGTTNMTLRNGYFGVFGLAFFIFGIVKTKRSFKTISLLAISLVFLILAAGDYTPFYKMAYHLPGFGTFRHPSFFRSHALMFLILISGIGFSQFLKNKAGFKWIWLGLIMTSFIGLFIGLNTGGSNLGALFEDVFNYIQKPKHSTSTFLALNAIFLIPILIAFFFVLKRYTKHLAPLVLVFTVLDLGVFTQITSPSTMTLPTKPTQQFSEFFERIPVDINQEAVNKPIKNIKGRVKEFKPYPVWMNVATFTKRVTANGANPTQMKSFNKLEVNGGLENVIENPIFFTGKYLVDSAALAIKPNTVWGSNILNDKLEISNGLIGYNSFSLSVHNPLRKPGIVVLNQNYHQLWKAKIKREVIEIIPVNDGLMGVIIPGLYSGQLWFEFDSPNTRLMVWVSGSAYLVLGLLLLFSFKNQLFQHSILKRKL